MAVSYVVREWEGIDLDLEYWIGVRLLSWESVGWYSQFRQRQTRMETVIWSVNISLECTQIWNPHITTTSMRKA